jgi:NADPH-dependent glutamate synthase beta subunit-like oxidoreductase/Pyruvate/2-oxoacid:ferredoxin oxidoreductase delta subunit
VTHLDHVDDYPEIPVSLGSTSAALKTGSWRSVRPVRVERSAPCAAGCPAGVAIPVYLDHVRAGRLQAALAEFALHNPFPRITGRVCPHRCEQACNLGATTGEGPVSIRAIERWLGDATARLPHPTLHPDTGRRVAVVGSGPAGLSAAYYLRRSGHDVTVFERRSRAGGMLRHAIPEYRLPSEIVDGEVARLEAMGITFLTGIELGVDLTLDDLEATHAAVFVATGAWLERMAGIPGEHLLDSGLAFLEAARRDEVTLPGPRCAVVGGGNTALDVARVLRKMGAEVTVLYRRTASEMPAVGEEYQAALAEGVVFEWLTLPRSVEKSGTGVVVTVETMRLGDPDASGRRRPEPTGSTRHLEFDGVYAAIGETADPTPLPGRLRGDDGRPAVGRDGTTSDPFVYAGGDLATGPATVVAAIAAGRSAARAIDHLLGFGDRWPVEPPVEVVEPDEVHPAHRVRHPAAAEASILATDPRTEERATITGSEALAEIERCLSCGHCNACGTCFVFCPDGAIRWEDGPVFDYEFCKGCGICVAECPGHGLILVSEREPAHA